MAGPCCRKRSRA